MFNIPNNGDTVFEYVPQNLNNGRKCYIEHKWKNRAYFINRLNAGLIYSNLDDLNNRIKFEKQMFHRFTKDNFSERYIHVGQKKFEKEYMCEWKSDK